MKILVTGAGGYIGRALISELHEEGLNAIGTTRETLNLIDVGDMKRFGDLDIVYLCAYKSRFIECEDDPTAYRINVDAQIEIARQLPKSKIIFLSSEAVERALHTNYGMHKALVETALLTKEAVIARICGKVTDSRLKSLAIWLRCLIAMDSGVYRWTT